MYLYKKLASLIIFLLLVSNQANAQCSYPEWTPCYPLPGCTWVTGDIASYDGKDWQLGSTAQGYREPGSLTGAAFWVEISNPCASPSGPTVAATEVRANYCTTSFAVGTITSDEGSAIIKRGFVFGTSTGPTIDSSDILVDAGTGTGDEFEGLMENLTPETDYYVRTFAINGIDTTYGTEATFTTLATSDCVTDCNLACDITDPSLTDPSAAWWSGAVIIPPEDTVCITTSVTIDGSVTLRGMLKICNSATVTIDGGISVQTSTLSNPSHKGQVIYEGCDEIFDGIGTYDGSVVSGIHDPLQMISYCGTCNENDTSQFFKEGFVPARWASTCRPTTSLEPLPVELIHFSTSKDEYGVLLEWTTVSEINNSHFEIELSYDGVSWTSIGIVQGSGNSATTIDYSFVNNQEEVGVQYYRLKQVDFNGDYAYSNIRYFSPTEEDKPSSFIAFQNIENKIEVNAIFHGTGAAYLIDSRGKIVEMKSFISSNKSGLRFNFESTNLNYGIYFVQIKSGNALLGQKVQVVQK